MEFKELGEHRVFLGFSIHTISEYIRFQQTIFYKYRKQTSILMDLHTFLTILFSENIGFSGGFQTIQNIGFQTLLMNSPTFHMLTFFKILVFSGNRLSEG